MRKSSQARFVRTLISEASGPVATYAGAAPSPTNQSGLASEPLSYQDSQGIAHRHLVLGFDPIGEAELG